MGPFSLPLSLVRTYAIQSEILNFGNIFVRFSFLICCKRNVPKHMNQIIWKGLPLFPLPCYDVQNYEQNTTHENIFGYSPSRYDVKIYVPKQLTQSVCTGISASLSVSRHNVPNSFRRSQNWQFFVGFCLSLWLKIMCTGTLNTDNRFGPLPLSLVTK